MFIVLFCSCLCPIHWSQVLSREWRCSWSSADRQCSNYIWVINNFILLPAKVSYITGLTVYCNMRKSIPSLVANIFKTFLNANGPSHCDTAYIHWENLNSNWLLINQRESSFLNQTDYNISNKILSKTSTEYNVQISMKHSYNFTFLWNKIRSGSTRWNFPTQT